MTLQKQLLLPFNLGGVRRSSPNHLKSIILQRGRLFLRGKHLRQLPIFPGVDVPADSAQGQSVNQRNYQKPKSSISDSTGLSKQVKGHDTKPVWLLGRAEDESLFSLKTRWQQDLG
ncbi:hypothetical protein XENORESO_010326 [Xenotaenia resolanae]|uniref:Uncharacterized protein n=1 Tax=Xenotaenia resolanae TaxID=208358 RepID=A0ABV0X1W3_9TELE